MGLVVRRLPYKLSSMYHRVLVQVQLMDQYKRKSPILPVQVQKMDPYKHLVRVNIRRPGRADSSPRNNRFHDGRESEGLPSVAPSGAAA